MVEEKPERHTKPLNARVVESDTEMRFELPFTDLDNMFYIGMNTTVDWMTNIHFHDHFELCYLDQGKLTYFIDKSLYHINQGELFITKPGERHYGLTDGISNFRLYYMGFKLDKMRAIEAEYYNIGVDRIVKDENRQIKRLFDEIIGEVRNKRQGSTEMVHGLFLQLLATLLRLHLDRTPSGDNKAKTLGPIIIKLMDYLHEEIRYDHNIEEIADKLHISRSHLAREFKTTTGMTIGEYIRNLCLDKAKFQLYQTDKSISLIGEELYFTSIHTFSIFFKHYMGMSPLEYRKHTRVK
ncbi:AraC family transcriptional regulator [Paenibacillus aceris]|uniref:AraC-like DNA-binding protein n=1 Tax=Paenibacillus aceris TaxID=869555 RepID=A0ABS4I1Z9_9BACL|nr:AraC family transcriptional regulator [Paenibacillus aceris]MBP1964939.1 AraC-like DNA-binding protein [Paenibacillus aceris]NHW35600.1 AraC family transcriptional regulator [Paenibacillus aceris]